MVWSLAINMNHFCSTESFPDAVTCCYSQDSCRKCIYVWHTHCLEQLNNSVDNSRLCAQLSKPRLILVQQMHVPNAPRSMLNTKLVIKMEEDYPSIHLDWIAFHNFCGSVFTWPVPPLCCYLMRQASFVCFNQRYCLVESRCLSIAMESCLWMFTYNLLNP